MEDMLSMADYSEDGAPLHNADALSNARIIDAGGRQASIVSLQHAGLDTLAWVRVADGPQVLVPVSLFALQPDGTYRLPFSFDIPSDDGDAQVSFPLLREELRLGKRTVDTGKGIRIHKTVSEDEQLVDQALLQDELVVEHIPVGVVVAGTDLPRMRYEGDTLVVPVFEEILVVQKQMRLKEEVRITRNKREVHAPQTVVLRTEQVAVERFDEGRSPSA
jgi:uncharacterized protein (TIGR02271 family)